LLGEFVISGGKEDGYLILSIKNGHCHEVPALDSHYEEGSCMPLTPNTPVNVRRGLSFSPFFFAKEHIATYLQLLTVFCSTLKVQTTKHKGRKKHSYLDKIYSLLQVMAGR